MNRHLPFALFLALLGTIVCVLGQSPASWSLVRPDGAPVTGKIRTSKDTSGKDALEYSYLRDGVELLAKPMPLSGFSRLSFKIWSQKQTIVIVMVEDGDHAKFHAGIPLQPGHWRTVTLTPANFQLNDDSPVKKSALDTRVISSPFVLGDVGKGMGLEGANVIQLLDLTIERETAQPVSSSLNVPAVIDGTAVSITRSGSIAHSVIIRNGGKLIISAPSVRIGGDITMDHGEMSMHNCSMSIDNKYQHQFKISLNNDSNLTLDGCRVHAPYVTSLEMKKSQLKIQDCQFDSLGFTCSPDESNILLENSQMSGEFVVQKGSHYRLNTCRGTLLWLRFDADQKADLSLPAQSGVIRSFSMPQDSKLDLSIADSRMIIWALLTTPGSSVAIKDSELMAAGLVFPSSNPTKVAHFKDGTPGAAIELTDRKLSLINTSIKTFTFYPNFDSHLEISDCTFGEMVASMHAQVLISESTCDGKGGYIRACDRASVRLINCTLNCPVVAADNGQLVLDHCTVNGDTSASGNSSIILRGSVLHGKRQELGNGRIKTES